MIQVAGEDSRCENQLYRLRAQADGARPVDGRGGRSLSCAGSACAQCGAAAQGVTGIRGNVKCRPGRNADRRTVVYGTSSAQCHVPLLTVVLP